MTASFDVLTIGHSNVAAAHFEALPCDAGVNAIADVRSVPFSRRFPWFSAKPLALQLQGARIAYFSYGDTLGGRPQDPTLYRDGIADYDAIAATAEFRDGLAHVTKDACQHRLCLMCAEREPLDCHRCLLVGRALAKRGVLVGHILGDGRVEPHSVTEDRLLSLKSKGRRGDLFNHPASLLAEAYDRRARAVAARAKGGSGRESSRRLHGALRRKP